MKCKQSVDMTKPQQVIQLLNQFIDLYFDEHGKEHIRSMEKG